MHIPRIPVTSRSDHPGAPARRSPSTRRFELERLEVRTALSSGLYSGLAATDSHGAKSAPALIGGVEASGSSASAKTPLTGEDDSLPPVLANYANLLPLASDLIDGLAGSITLLGQAFRDGVPTSVLIDHVAEATGSSPAEIPLDVIRMGAAAAFTAQEAGIALPATVAGLEAMSAASQTDAWLSAAVGRIEALAAVDGSTPPSQARTDGLLPAASPYVRDALGAYVKAEVSAGDSGSTGQDPSAPAAPPFLISLGKFFIKNIETIYSNYIQSSDNTSISMASRPGGIAPGGLESVADSTAATVQETQDIGWAGAGGISSVLAGEEGPALSLGQDFQGGTVPRPYSSSEEPAPPASIVGGDIPLDILLKDPESSPQDVPIVVQEIAELIPVEDSSLALVATLWTVPSEFRPKPADGSDPSGELAEPLTSLASPPPWLVFVTGLDEAFERSGQDARRTIFSDRGGPSEGDGAGDVLDERLEWRCPSIPTTEGRRRPGRAEPSIPYVGPAAIDRAAPSPGADSNGPRPARSSGAEEPVAGPSPDDGSSLDAGEGRPLIEGAVRSVLAASVSALIAGWFMARGQLRPGGAPGRVGRTGHRRGRTVRFEAGP